MRILFVALAVPFPPNNGQRLRNWGLLQGLAEEGHSVALLSFGDPYDFCQDLADLRGMCESVQFIPSPSRATGRWREPLERIRTLAAPLPYGAYRYRSREMEAAVRASLDRGKFDVVLCDDIYLFRNLPETVRPCVLLNKHDLTFVVLERLLARTWNPLKLAYGRLECWKLRRWEAVVSSKVARTLVCSELDGRLLKGMVPGIRVTIAPNVIDVKGYVPKECDEDKTMLFFGAMDYHANQDAVEYFVARILPEVRSVVPEVKFVVAGRNPPEKFRRWLTGVPGVKVTGSIPDMRTEIAKAAVCVVPLRIGSGTRLKILEAGAMAKPIVSTYVGAEGLDFEDGKEILLADTPGEFARAIVALLHSESRRREIGQAARRRVERQYSLSALRSAIRNALPALSDEASPAPPESEVLLHREMGRP